MQNSVRTCYIVLLNIPSSILRNCLVRNKLNIESCIADNMNSYNLIYNFSANLRKISNDIDNVLYTTRTKVSSFPNAP